MAEKIQKTGGPPAPLYPDELVTQLKPREPLRSAPEAPLELSFVVPSDVLPQIDTSVAVIEQKNGNVYEVKLSVRGAMIGKHALRPPIEIRKFSSETDIRERQKECPGCDGYLPDHLSLRLTPDRLPDRLKVPRRIRSFKLPDRERDLHQATTIFPPDSRYTFNDTAFPWCTVGRVDTPGGQASGVMVGPRHMLTCSHAIQWNANNTAGWVKFTPAYFDGSAPFGVAWGTMIYWEEDPRSTVPKGQNSDKNSASGGAHMVDCIIRARNDFS